MSLEDFELLALPGGFSFGDDFGAGKILALELELKFSDKLVEFIHHGKGVLGICNGFQTLVEMGFPFGFPSARDKKVATLAPNKSGNFESRWVRLKPENMMHLSNGETLMLPVSHGEGRFVTADKEILKQIEQRGIAAWTYCDIDGQPTDEFPFNPNGSDNNLAGISDSQVTGIMPHPERFLHLANYINHRREKIVKPHGLIILEQVVNYVR